MRRRISGWVSRQQRKLFLLACILIGAAFTLTLSSRLPPFWSSSALLRLACLASGTGILALLFWRTFFAPAKVSTHPLAVPLRGAANRMGFALFFLLFFPFFLDAVKPLSSLPPIKHTLTISALAEHHPLSSGFAVSLVELRGIDGAIAGCDLFQREAGWGCEGGTLTFSGEAPSRLTYDFFSRSGPCLHLLFATGPSAGMVSLTLDQKVTSLDLYEAVEGNRTQELPITADSMLWKTLLLTADVISALILALLTGAGLLWGVQRLRQALGRRVEPGGSTPEPAPSPLIYGYLFALTTGAFALFLLILCFLPGGIRESEEFMLFVLGWIAVPLTVLGTLLLLRRWQETQPDRLASILPKALLVNLSLASLVVACLYLMAPSHTDPVIFWLHVFSIFILLVGVSLVLVAGYPRQAHLPWIVTLLAGFIGLHFTPFSPLQVLLCAGLGLVFLLFTGSGTPGQARRWKWAWLLDLPVLVGICLTCIDPQFTVDYLHQGFFLGPVNRLLHGGLMLVDTYSQYGVLNLIGLAAIFRSLLLPFTFEGFSLFISILYILQFSALYFIFLALFRSRLYSLLTLALALLLGIVEGGYAVQYAPSVGPFRFGMPLLLLVVVFLRRQRAGRKILLFLEYLIISLSALYSLETFLYTLFPYLGICLYESALAETAPHKILLYWLRRCALVLGICLLAHALFVAYTYAVSGQLPNWLAYLDFPTKYSTDYGVLPVSLWDPWIFPPFIALASLSIYFFQYFCRHRLGSAPGDLFIFGLTLTSIPQYTYFLARSHPQNLFHVSLPCLIVASYWVYRIARNASVSQGFRHSLQWGYLTTALLIGGAMIPNVIQKYPFTGYAFVSQVADRWYHGEDTSGLFADARDLLLGNSLRNENVDAVVRLIERYSPPGVAITLVTADDTNVLMRAGRTESLPLSRLEEDNISTVVSQIILHYPLPLQAGDIIYVEKDADHYTAPTMSPLGLDLIDRLCSAFSLQRIETVVNKEFTISAMRLEPLESKVSPYCQDVQRLKEPE